MTNTVSIVKAVDLNKRIKSIDGWRAIAALGVLYTHAWALSKFPSLMIGSVDILRVINLWGNGVHLFFVISGFCFYYLLQKNATISWTNTLFFWKKRWLRIAPAFYTVCVFYVLYYFVFSGSNEFDLQILFRIGANYLFIQNHVANTEIHAIFWSLAVEWHFYLLLPLLFYCFEKLGFFKTVTIAFIICLLINILHYYSFLLPGDNWWYTIFANLEHFLWGILLAYFFLHSTSIQGKKKGYLFYVGLIVAYAGKILFTSDFVKITGDLYGFFEAIGPLVMTLGFAILIYSSLVNPLFKQIIGNKIFAWIGKISFSFYLWHALILDIVYVLIQPYLPQGPVGLAILFALVLAFLLPISYVSYILLEKPYFNRRSNEKTSHYNYTPHTV